MSETVSIDDLLDTDEAARLLGIKPNTLEIYRCRGGGPPFIKLGDSSQAPVRYLRSVVMQWLENRSFASTSEYKPTAPTTRTSRTCGSGEAS